MTLMTWSPMREMEEFQSEMDRLFSRFYGTNGTTGRQNRQGLVGTWVMPLDVVEREDGIGLRAALPGVRPEDINIQLEDNVLTLRAERRYEQGQGDNGRHWVEQNYGVFTRQLTLPKYADTERIQASYEHGVLELVIPKRESAKPRKIELQLGNGAGPRQLEAAGVESTAD